MILLLSYIQYLQYQHFYPKTKQYQIESCLFGELIYIIICKTNIPLWWQTIYHFLAIISGFNLKIFTVHGHKNSKLPFCSAQGKDISLVLNLDRTFIRQIANHMIYNKQRRSFYVHLWKGHGRIAMPWGNWLLCKILCL